MIRRTPEGRAFSVRTVEEERLSIADGISNLSQDEKKLLELLLSEIDGGDDSLLATLTEYLYRRVPVSIEQFMDDDYYLGMSTQTLYPGIRSALIDLFQTPGYREAIFGGAIGVGKTTFLSVAMSYILYQMSCLRSPQLSYGLSPGSEIVIALISKSLPLSRTVLKTAVEDKIKISPYFREVFVPKYGRDVTDFPGNIQLAIGSCYSQRILGMNVFAGGMDEANFMEASSKVMSGDGKTNSVANYDLAEKTYTNLARRIKSRFLGRGGDLPGMMILVSSANVSGGFTDRHISRNRDNPYVFVREYATWDVKPDSFSGDKFRVLVGSGAMRSKILSDADPEPTYEVEQGANLIEVPIEYKTDFERDLEGSIRDIAGVSTTAISPYIHRVEKIESAVNKSVVHPFSVTEWTYGSPGEILWHRIAKRSDRMVRGYKEEVWQPIRRPECPRHIHLDAAISGDSLGIAMGYVDRWVDVVRRDTYGKEYIDVQPYFVIDFMLRVIPPFGDQIFLGDIRALIYQFIEHGFPVSSFTCDQYQSVDTLQQISRWGVKTSLLSVDRTTEPYDTLKAALYESRIEIYDYEPVKQELRSLEYDKGRGKIDHPIAGSKDVADALAGCVAGLAKQSTRLPISPVAPNASEGVDSMDWVTGGMVPVTSDTSLSDLVPKTRSGNASPLPFIIG